VNAHPEPPSDTESPSERGTFSTTESAASGQLAGTDADSEQSVAAESPQISQASEKRHTAPITPLVHGVQVGGVLGLLVGVNVLSSGGLSLGPVLAVVGIVLLVVLAAAAVAYLQWQRLVYWFDSDGDLRVASGVLQKRERRLHLSRLQSVEVVQPLLARIFGMAQVRVEVAGAGDSRVTLSYLTVSNANDLRAETLARAAGVRPDAGEAPESVIVQVPSGALFWSGLLDSGVLTWLVLSLAGVVVLSITVGPLGVLGLLVVVAVPVIGAFGQFTTYFNFTVADSPDGLRTRCGLLGVQAHTVPPGRVASIEFAEPLLWRRFGWVSIRLNVAGVRADSDGGTAAANTLLPVATWDVATDVVHRLFPGLDVPSFPFQSVPEQVKWRSPMQRRWLGLGADAVMMGTRRGWLKRRTTFTPHARVQSVRLVQGPWQRRLGLASVHGDVVPGPVHVVGRHQSAEVARQFVFAEVERVRAATQADTSVRWGVPTEVQDSLGPAPAPGRSDGSDDPGSVGLRD